ncbi:RNA polymerase sigma factor [Rhodothermus marinus]|uniref:RNA polymerase sigma factor n=1 Tax=Rhodothermus marinus TaxID=29549 RepID=UPI0012BA4531|nr:sigma-70 family RNA polymerase sigma factor [Rhodothermus marinus]BBM69798.1 RNA polymerase subunit sigma-24 [Rhodothermus marinus]BBM72784.1 RNA polymerase subunit sigma-24 [Rhodothermus marinus]
METETSWIVAMQRGCPRAFSLLYRAYYERLLGVAARRLGEEAAAQDVVQDVFLKLWERRAHWKVYGNVEAYLHQAVCNRVRDYQRRARLRKGLEVPLEPRHDVMGRSSPESRLLLRERYRLLEAELARMPRRMRTAFVLSRWYGYRHPEIARLMHISPRTVEVHVRRALRRLQRALQEDHEATGAHAPVG